LVAHQLGSPRPLSVNQIEQVRMAKARYLQNADFPNGLKHNPESVPDNAHYTDRQIE
jgi:hypothetical protein